MVRVVHFEYLPQVFGNYLHDFEQDFKTTPEIDYQVFPPTVMKGKLPDELNFFDHEPDLEEILKTADVFFAHPGVNAYPTVIEDYPLRFPNLEIVILTFLLDKSPENLEKEYHEPGLGARKEIKFFQYDDLSGIKDFLLSVEKAKKKE